MRFMQEKKVGIVITSKLNVLPDQAAWDCSKMPPGLEINPCLGNLSASSFEKGDYNRIMLT